MPEVAGRQGVIAGLADGQLSVDTTAKTADFSITVYRGGFGDTSTFSVEAGVNNDLIEPLISSGALPAGTVPLGSDAYTMVTTVPLQYQDGVMQGRLQPRISIAALSAYTGKTVAIGMELKSSTKFSINDTMRKVVIYFNVDSLPDGRRAF